MIIDIEKWIIHCMEKMEITTDKEWLSNVTSIRTTTTPNFASTINSLSNIALQFSLHKNTIDKYNKTIEDKHHYSLVCRMYMLLLYLHEDIEYSEIFKYCKKEYFDHRTRMGKVFKDDLLLETYADELSVMVAVKELDIKYNIDDLSDPYKLNDLICKENVMYYKDDMELEISTNSKTASLVVTVCHSLISSILELDLLGYRGMEASGTFSGLDEDEKQSTIADYKERVSSMLLMSIIISSKFMSKEEVKEFSIESDDDQSEDLTKKLIDLVLKRKQNDAKNIISDIIKG